MSFNFFRAFVASAALIIASPAALGQSLEQIIERYEAFDRAGDPEQSAKANNESSACNKRTEKIERHLV
ncbi:MAG: hypothetical protein AAGJ51_14250, partial [Pseudomonadota bacterium]